ncbi:MAG TPA: hypothetical protein VFD84_01840 [Candidatus Binatia bacterium]|nr:hypothetical protein [Candidatus Binatia bacterium]
MRTQTARRILAGCIAALGLAFVPPAATAATPIRCERALAKASAKFVGAAFKSAQRCVVLRQANKLPATACSLMAESIGSPKLDQALAHATARLAKGTSPCTDGMLADMGFQAACSDVNDGGAFTRADLNSCIAHTHRQAVQALVSIQFPLGTSSCGDGVIDVDEDCDPVASPSGCATGETCVAAGTPDECTCIEAGAGTCGDGTVDTGEQCDPAAQPTGCPAGMNCSASCACESQSATCQGTCTPACGAGQTCRCECAGAPTGACGNGTRDAGEQCDPLANPSGCAAGMICGAPGTATQCTCTAGQPGQACGNGMLDPGESCDPALPNTCDPGEVCLASGAMACTCGAPPSNCGNGLIEWGEQCDPSANPTGCSAGQTCNPRGGANQCTCSTGGTGMCGNGSVDTGEQCDPAASPTGCAAGQTCSGSCTCTGGGASCGNGTIDTGEQCDPSANPTGCPAGASCNVDCTCGTGVTTTTMGGPPGGMRLSFTTTVGSTSCGGPSFAGFDPPAGPFSGEVDGAAGKLGDLGLGCLYVGGGNGATPANLIPDASQSLFDVGTPSGGTVPLVAGNGTGRENCTKGAGPGKHCVGGSGGPISCTADAQCGGTAGSCALDANCNFGPPLPIGGSLPVCVLNVIQTDASGTATLATGESTVDIPLSSMVYLTANGTSPCPKCVGGTCDSSWRDGGGNPSPDAGAACTPTGTQGTSLACGVPLGDFQGALPVRLNPLSTGATMLDGPGGTFCQGQTTPGALHLTGATTIKETGSPAGDLTDGASHPSVLAATFCIPASASAAINSVGGLPGPGAIGLSGNAQLLQ